MYIMNELVQENAEPTETNFEGYGFRPPLFVKFFLVHLVGLI